MTLVPGFRKCFRFKCFEINSGSALVAVQHFPNTQAQSRLLRPVSHRGHLVSPAYRNAEPQARLSSRTETEPCHDLACETSLDLRKHQTLILRGHTCARPASSRRQTALVLPRQERFFRSRHCRLLGTLQPFFAARPSPATPRQSTAARHRKKNLFKCLHLIAPWVYCAPLKRVTLATDRWPSG